MIIVYTMLNSSGEFPNPAFGIGGVFDSYAECQGGLLERQTQKHVMRKNDDNKHVLFSNDGEYIWVESCVPSLGWVEMSMTKHLTKPIRAIHVMVLAFLVTICTYVSAEWLSHWIIGLDVLC